jgi:NAD(P)H-dependent flavin oxidoreductase YrpB (nitropropane dioxygenase family)
MWESRFTREHGIELPFVSAGMGLVAGPELAAAVSNAGGLGLIGAVSVPPPLLAEMIRAARARTARPFGLNLIIETQVRGPRPDDEHIDVCAAERVPVVTFHWGLPPPAWIERLHAAGSRVWIQVGSLAAAREAARLGADALIVQGSEAGGHNRSEHAASALVPAVLDAVAPRFVIQAGGVADGRGVVAALALGADAVCVGTRLLASRESLAHADYKQRVVAASVDDVTRTRIFGPEWPDQPMKVIRNRVVSEYAGRDGATPSAAGAPIGRTRLFGSELPMPRFSALLPTADTSGDLEEMCLTAGESAGLVADVRPAGEIVRAMMAEAARVVAERLAPLVGLAERRPG